LGTVTKGYLGDYPDKRLIEISKKIIEGRLKNE